MFSKPVRGAFSCGIYKAVEKEHLKEIGRHAGLRSIAILEALKGLVVILVAVGLLHYLHRDIGDAAERLVRHLHISPAHHFAQAFLHMADKVDDGKLWAIIAGAFVYAAVRFIEAYGLWHELAWAEWFALLSGGLYLPWEIYEMAEKATLFRSILFGTNVAVVLYMIWIRFSDPAKERQGVLLRGDPPLELSVLDRREPRPK